MRRTRHNRSPHCHAALFAVALSLSGCSNPFAEDAPSLTDILGAGWLVAADDEVADAAVEGPLYCYRTIGREDCYAEPLPREGGRLVGFQGPPPPTYDAF